MAAADEVLQWPGFASDDPDGTVLAAVKADLTLAELVRFDPATGNTIFRAFGPGGDIVFEDAAGNPLAGNAHALGSHADVSVTTPATGDVLRWSGVEWVNQAASFAEKTSSNDWAAAQLPDATLTRALGSTTRRWNNLYSGGGDFAGNVTIGGSFGLTGGANLATADGANVVIGSAAAAQAWTSTFSAAELGFGGALMYSSRTALSNLHISNNAFYDGAWKRKTLGPATMLQFQGSTGDFVFNVKGSDAAGSPIGTWTEAVRFANSGAVSFTGGSVAIGNGAASAYNDLDLNGATTANYGPVVLFRAAGTVLGRIGRAGRINGGTSDALWIGTATANAIEFYTNGTKRGELTSGGTLAWGTAVVAAAVAGPNPGSGGIVVPNGKGLFGVNGAGTAANPMAILDASNNLNLGWDPGFGIYPLLVHSSVNAGEGTALTVRVNNGAFSGQRRIRVANSAAAVPAGAYVLFVEA